MTFPLAAIERKYEVLAKISEGGMGAVYKVRHRLLGEVRVVKIMRPHLATDERARERFIREARLAGGLKHPNIAQIFDFAVDDQGSAYLVMEFIDGVTLQELLKRIGPPPVGLTVELACQTLDALACLHSRGIVHRDISPDNIMAGLDENQRPRAKLIDLGIAKLVESDASLTATGMFVGKVRYSSPEHFKGPEGVRVDARSDLYSLGVVLYELLTGTHPVPGSGVSNLIAGHLFHLPEPFARVDPEGRVPPALQSVVFQALAKDPAQRPADADAFATALRRAADGLAAPTDELRRIIGEGAAALEQRSALHVMATQETSPPGAGAPPDATLPGDQASAQPTRSTRRPPKTGAIDPEQTAYPADATLASRPPRIQPAVGKVGARLPLWVRAAAAVAALFVLTVAAWWWGLGSPAAPRPGVLVIDASPWATIRSVIDQDDREIPLDQPAYTPLRLSVPPGQYHIVLARDGTEHELDAHIEADQVIRRVAHFDDVSVDQLVSALGL